MDIMNKNVISPIYFLATVVMVILFYSLAPLFPVKWFTVWIEQQLPKLLHLGIIPIYVTFYFLSGMALIEYAFLFLERSHICESTLQTIGRYRNGRWNDNYLGRSEGTQTAESTRPHSPGFLAFYDHKTDYFITPGDYFLLQSGSKHVCLYVAQFLTLR